MIEYEQASAALPVPADATRRPGVHTATFRRVAGPAPSWLATLRPGRRVDARPNAAVPVAVAIVASLGWLAVAGYGMDFLDVLWSLAAAVAAFGAVIPAVRGYPLPAVVALPAAVVFWGLAARETLPASITDVVGDLRFLAVMLVFAVPLVLATVAAVAIDGRLEARVAVEEALTGKRWWNEEGDHLPQLVEFEAIPSARFYAQRGGICSHVVSVGRRIVLVCPTVWPRGEYTMDVSGEVQRDGRPFGPGTDDIGGLATELRAWVERLESTGAQCRGYVMVFAPRDTEPDAVRVEVPQGERLNVVTADTFAERAGAFLAAEPYRLDVDVTRILLAETGP